MSLRAPAAVDMKGERFPRRYGPLILVRPLAEGGMGTVDLGLIDERGQVGACVVKRPTGDQTSEMLESEGRIVLSCRHDGIVRGLRMGRVGGEQYLALEFVHGWNLSTLMGACATSERWMSVPLVAYVIGEVARALGYLDSLRVVHGDVSPDNIMVSFDGRLKLIDFGIAKMDGDVGAAAAGVRRNAVGVVGREEYAAPEVKRGNAQVDGRADIYSLGVVLWRLLARRRVTDVFLAPMKAGEDATSWCPPRPSIWNADVSSAADEIVRRTLAFGVGERFQTGAQVGDALAELVPQGFDGRTELARFLSGLVDVERQRALLEEDLGVGRRVLAVSKRRRARLLLSAVTLGLAASAGWAWSGRPTGRQNDDLGWRREGVRLVRAGRLAEAKVVVEREISRNPENEIALSFWSRLIALQRGR